MPWTLVLSEQLEHLKTSLGISYEELAQVLGTDRKTVYRWLADETFPRAHNRARLDELEVLVDRLDESFKTSGGSAPSCGLRPGHHIAQIARDVAEALLVPSCARFPEGNLVIFPDLLRVESTIVVEDTQDPDLFVDWKTL